MAKVLVIHGAGMNMRGKVQTEIFGPMTLPEYDERIRGYASALGLEVEIFHSNVEGEIVNKLYEANDRGFDAAIFNPAAFGSGYPALVAAISQVKFPTIEVQGNESGSVRVDMPFTLDVSGSYHANVYWPNRSRDLNDVMMCANLSFGGR